MKTHPSETRDERAKVPASVEWEIKDLIRPITLRRRTLWTGAGILVGLVLTALGAWLLFFAPPSGKALLAQAVEAAGGMERWSAIDDGSFTRVHTIYDETGAVESRRTETFHFRTGSDWNLLIESTSELGHVLIGRDEDGYWATRDGETALPVVVARSLGMMCESEYCTPQCGAEMALFRFSLPFKLTDPGVRPTNAGRVVLNGRPAYLLDVTYDPDVGQDRWTFYVDAETRLIRKVEHYASVDGDAPPEEIFWSDHREVEGITFSHRRTYYRSNGTKLEEYTITEADFNRGLADEMFVNPKKRPVQAASSI